MAENGSKWLKMADFGLKRLKMADFGLKNGSKISKMAQNQAKMAQNPAKMAQMGPSGRVKKPEKGYLGPLDSGPGPDFHRPEAYGNLKNDTSTVTPDPCMACTVGCTQTRTHHGTRTVAGAPKTRTHHGTRI